MTDVNQRIAECGKQMAMAAIPAFTTDGKVHPPTVVAAVSRMAGAYLFRSLGHRIDGLAPGSAVLSPQADAQLPVLMRTTANILATFGKTLPEGPAAPVEEELAKIRCDLFESVAKLDPVFAPLRTQFELDDAQMARAGGVATGVTIHAVSKIYDHARAFGLAVYGFNEGAKTVPKPAA
jgi:hypothetical protein